MTEWRPVPGYPKYAVSADGQVRHVRKSRALKPQAVKNGGHLRVLLMPDKRLLRVHRLVLLAFVGEPPEGKPLALHRDGNPKNNALSNLYWGSPQNNMDDKARHGNNHEANKTHCKDGHEFTPENTLRRAANPNWRQCRECNRITCSARYAEKKRRATAERWLLADVT